MTDIIANHPELIPNNVSEQKTIPITIHSINNVMCNAIDGSNNLPILHRTFIFSYIVQCNKATHTNNNNISIIPLHSTFVFFCNAPTNKMKIPYKNPSHEITLRNSLFV